MLSVWVRECTTLSLYVFIEYHPQYRYLCKYINLYTSIRIALYTTNTTHSKVSGKCVAVRCSALQCVAECVAVRCSALQCVAVRCSALQCDAVCCSALQCVAVCCSALQCVAVCCSALQCVAVRCRALQCIAVRRSVLQCVLQCDRPHELKAQLHTLFNLVPYEVPAHLSQSLSLAIRVAHNLDRHVLMDSKEDTHFKRGHTLQKRSA